MSDPAKLHSTLVGGSSAARVLACPGSIPLVGSFIAKNRSSAAADEGTALHLATEHVLENDLLPESIVGMTFHGHEMTEELVDECIVPCIEQFDKIVGTRAFELEVSAPFPGIAGAFGTADVVYYDDAGGLVGIMDWKFGVAHKVDVAENAQMMFYLLSQLARPEVSLRPQPSTLAATIVQPRLHHYDTAQFTHERLLQFKEALKDAIGRTDVHKGPHCYFCPAKPICPEKWGKKAERLKKGLARLAGSR